MDELTLKDVKYLIKLLKADKKINNQGFVTLGKLILLKIKLGEPDEEETLPPSASV